MYYILSACFRYNVTIENGIIMTFYSIYITAAEIYYLGYLLSNI